jgi:hypothetical protein
VLWEILNPEAFSDTDFAILYSMLFFRTFALLTASAQAATTIDKVFSVKTGTGPGSCDRTYNRAQNGGSAKYIDTLTAFWEDTAMLVEQARKGLDRYTENNVHGLLVRRHLAGWFGIEFDFDGTSHGPKGQDDRSRLENIVGQSYSHAPTHLSLICQIPLLSWFPL